MSAEDMRRLTIDRLTELKKTKLRTLRSLKFTPGNVVSTPAGVTAVPPTTLEYVGAMHSITVAEMDLLDDLADIVNDTYRALTSPVAAPEDEQESEAKQEDIY